VGGPARASRSALAARTTLCLRAPRDGTCGVSGGRPSVLCRVPSLGARRRGLIGPIAAQQAQRTHSAFPF
jgi:hypothetical protein